MSNISAEFYLEFIENNVPALKAGTYRFTVKQNLKGKELDAAKPFTFDLPDSTTTVKVEGERFTLNPAEIAGVFPPANSLGHYDNVIPQIAFRRDTLPWERNIAADDKNKEEAASLPWMALLVLNEEDFYTDKLEEPKGVVERQQAEGGYVETKSSLDKQQLSGTNWPPAIEPEKEKERFKVIYLKKTIAETILPQGGDLKWMAHARKNKIGLTGTKKDDTIKVFDEKGQLVHEEVALGDNYRMDYGYLQLGKYTIKVKDEEINGSPIHIKSKDQVGIETAIIIGNRLPRPGRKTIVHLVSLEGRYKKSNNDFEFDFDGYDKGVPFVSLHNWSFSVLTEKETFRHLLLHLNHHFLFGINILPNSTSNDWTIENLKPGFIKGRHPLSKEAEIEDRATKELRDKDHCFYFGEKGAVYNAAGKRIEENRAIPQNDNEAINSIKEILNIDLHQNSAKLSLAKNQLWIRDGEKQYFLSKEIGEDRLSVHLLPVDNRPSLRLPSREGKGGAIDLANGFLTQGYVPLPHSFRRGGKSVSLYRSPLMPGRPVEEVPDDFPVHAADRLLRYHNDYGLFDTSYAAPWELGRLLCLNNKRISLELYRWKRTHIRLLKVMEQQYLHPHLPFQATPPEKVELPEELDKWLSNLSLLKGVPFSYLVPDQQMLPPESLRFFYLDPLWVASMMDGAMSIGRVDSKDSKHHEVVHRQMQLLIKSPTPDKQISGFLMRSSVVKGWPHLQAKAYNEKITQKEGDPEKELVRLRMERLSDQVLICLFEGHIKTLDIFEKPETIHLGFNHTEEVNQFDKYPIKADGTASDTKVTLADALQYDKPHRLIDISQLAESLKGVTDLAYGNDFTSAQFALSLTQGVSRVRFTAS